MPDWKQYVRDNLRLRNLRREREEEIVADLATQLEDAYNDARVRGLEEPAAIAFARQQVPDWEVLARDLQQSPRGALGPIGRIERHAADSPADSGFNAVFSSFVQDVLFAARMMRKNPGFTAVVLLSLALGIGANTAIFQLIDAVRMRTLPVKNPQELAVIRPTNSSRTGRMTGRFSYMTSTLYNQVRARQEGFSGVFAFGTAGLNLANGGQVRYARNLWVSGEFFDVLGLQPVLGRLLHPADDHPGCGTPGAVLSYSFWQREFGGDPQVLSKTVSLEGHAVPILGVAPAGFNGPEIGFYFDVALPLCSEPIINADNSIYALPHGWWLTMMGRLKPGWSHERASAQLDAISRSIMEQTLPPTFTPVSAEKYLSYHLHAYPGATGVSHLRRDYETPLWLLLAIAGLVLLIACANLANLMLARAAAREREIAVRMALGAARTRLLRQLLTESALLAVTGAILGAALARILSELLVNYLRTQGEAHILVDLSMDWRVLGFTTALAVLTSLLFGLAPAFKATSAPPAKIISLAGRGLSAGRERFSLRRALVITQVALSLVLVVTALLFTGSLRKILSLDAGFQREGLLVMDVDYTRLKLPKDQRVPFADALLARVRALPGIEKAATTTVVPLGGDYWNDRVIIDGKRNDLDVDMSTISDGYFKTMGTPLLAGRDFNENDTANSPKVAIVNQQFARKILGVENPVGRRYKIDVYKGEAQPEYEIVGLVRDTKYVDLREDFPPLAFYPNVQYAKPYPATEVLVRSNLDLESLLNTLRRAVADFNPEVAIDFHVYSTQVKEGLLRERLMATLSGAFGALAIILATIGLYGVIAYMVVRRTNEIGIRMALGALPRRILTMVLGEAVVLLGAGIVIGILLAIAAGRAAATLLFGLKPHDPAVLAIGCVTLAAIAVCASLLPARRAARLEPTVALREE